MEHKCNLPSIFFYEKAFFKSFLEVRKFFAIGLMNENKPWEAAMYPLAYLNLRKGINKSPHELVTLDEIESIIITDVLYPLDKYKNYGPSHAGFKSGANSYLNPIITKCLKKYPLLDTFCKMHSHPLGGRYLSAGDLNCSIYNSHDWFRKKGLNTMFSFVMFSNKESWYKLEGWNILAFGLNNKNLNVELPVVVISSCNKLIKEAKSKPYYQSMRGAFWSKITDRELLSRGYNFFIEDIRRGWRKYVFTFGDKRVFILFPPFFPKQVIKVLILPSQNNATKILDLDKRMIWSKPGNDIDKYIMCNLIEKIRRMI